MHNFGVPSVLKLWIDQIAPRGRTFCLQREEAEGPDRRQEGDLIIATGGIYDAQTRMASFNFVSRICGPYLVFLA